MWDGWWHGGGQVIYATNVNIPVGTYNIFVGSGGNGGVSNNGTNGVNSIAFGATANGGGGGGGVGGGVLQLLPD